MPGGIGPLELVIVLVIVLVVFGPKRLPSLGRQLGAGMREFKDSVTGKSSDDEGDDVSGQIARASESAGHPADEQRAREPQPRA
jgi:sec-independent protein translocase protein TatA